MSKWENCFNIFSHMLPTFSPIIELGLSTEAYTRPTRGESSDPYSKPADLTLVTVGSGFQPPKTEIGKSVDGSTLQNPIPTNPTAYISETPTDFLKYEDFQSFLDRFIEISLRTRQDLFKIWWVCLEILLDLAMFWPDLADFGQFRPDFAWFHLPRVRPTTNRSVLDIRVSWTDSSNS